MSIDHAKQADQILLAEKASRPRWRSFDRMVAPAWFSGAELDLLEPEERGKLYWKIRSRDQSNRMVLFIVAVASIPNIARGLQSESGRWLWIAVAIGFILVAIGAWVAKRRSILTSARREVRESPDWPLRFQSRIS